VVRSMNDRMASIVSTGLLVLLIWMEVMVTSIPHVVGASISGVVWTHHLTDWSMMRVQNNVATSRGILGSTILIVLIVSVAVHEISWTKTLMLDLE
jgi:hypothetical protein